MAYSHLETCYQCRKQFYIPDRYSYAYQKQRVYYDNAHSIKWFCSWHCLRAEEKEHERMKEERRLQYAKRKTVHGKRMD